MFAQTLCKAENIIKYQKFEACLIFEKDWSRKLIKLGCRLLIHSKTLYSQVDQTENIYLSLMRSM